MRDFEWAENNLRVAKPHELQDRGVNVYFAPRIEPRKVVNLADGRVDVIQEQERRPQTGYYADFQSLANYCREAGLPFAEVDGAASIEP